MNPMTHIAARAAREAGKLLLRYFNRMENIPVEEKQANDFVTEVDRASEKLIIGAIRKAYPDHAILAEESGDHAGNDYLWIIDPLDGTTNYLHGFPQFSISIALQHRDQLVAAVVHDPLRDETFTAHKGGGAYLNERRIRVSKSKDLHGALLGTGIPYRDQRFVDNYFGMMKALIRDAAGVRRPGSAALDFAWLAAGRIDGFWELGLARWDFAAGALLVQEAGGVVTDLAGGQRHFETGNVVAGNVKIHPVMLETIRPFLGEGLKA
jgi:myo-inositol-1(or 4)-monophosphatase